MSDIHSIWETKKWKDARYSLEYYKWLEAAMVKRGIDYIWVNYDMRRSGKFTLESVRESIAKEELESILDSLKEKLSIA